MLREGISCVTDRIAESRPFLSGIASASLRISGHFVGGIMYDLVVVARSEAEIRAHSQD